MENLVVKSNALIEAGHRLSLTEQRIVLSAITQVRRDVKPNSEAWYTISANALADISGISASRAYHDLATAVETLWQREIVVKGGPNGSAQTPKKNRVMKARWVQAIEYIPEEGSIRLMFSAPVVPYLVLLKEQFTRYELQYVAPMKTRFGPRLYELLVQWRQAGEREVSIADLQEMWGTNYTRIFDFKKRVVAHGVRDVNDHSDLEVTVGYRKTGRRVTHVQFQFQPKNGAEADAAPPKKKPAKKRVSQQTDSDRIRQNARPGETWEQARRRLGL